MRRLTLAMVFFASTTRRSLAAVADEDLAVRVERHDAGQQPAALLVGEHVDAPASHAGDDGVRRAEVDSDDRHRRWLSMIRTLQGRARRRQLLFQIGDRPRTNHRRMVRGNGPHPAVVGPDEALHDLALERARRRRARRPRRWHGSSRRTPPTRCARAPRRDRAERAGRGRRSAIATSPIRRRWRRWTRSWRSRM